MTIIAHNNIPLNIGIGTRSKLPSHKIVTAATGAKQCELWEQFMEIDGEIPIHYHTCEEIITFVSGQIDVTIGTETTRVEAPASVFVPPQVLHGFRNPGPNRVHLLAFFPISSPETLYQDA
jgi:mannose-6-phosphate isomerase-like protein (cupin superfamily)